MKKLLVFFIAVMLFLGMTGPANASIINGGFETGDYSGWTTIGRTGVVDSSWGSGPTGGTYQAVMGTGNPDVGSQPVNETDLLNFVGVPPGSCDSDCIEGSGIKQTFSANAGNIISFDWNFLTNEETPDPDYNDFAFVVFSSGSLPGGWFGDDFADTYSSFISSPTTNKNEETGFFTYNYTIEYTGTYTFAIGIMDVGNARVSSALLVDNVQQSAVPEPATMLLLGSGILCIAMFGRKKFK